MPEIAPGYILAGKYEIENVLGVGGMGVVVAARHIRLDERVAIKFLTSDAMNNPEAVARFDREARAAVRIKNEHVVRIMDVATLDNGSPYLVMEYLEGEDLSVWLTQRKSLPIELAVDFVIQACEGVGAAHAAGIIHRDLKPANLFCSRGTNGSCTIKVLDFGISKALTIGRDSAKELRMTKTGAVMGSPAYMSPEQMVSARDVDARTDQWSLGVILFELLAGSTPFSGDTLPEICIRIASHPPEGLRSFRPDVPPELEAIILRCLEKDRNARFTDLADLATALSPFAMRHGRVSTDGLSRRNAGTIQLTMPGEVPVEHAGSSGAWGQTTPPSTARRPRITLRAALWTAGSVAVLAAAGFWTMDWWLPRVHDGGPTAAAGSSVTADAVPPAEAASAAPQEEVRIAEPSPALLAPSASATAESLDSALTQPSTASIPTRPSKRLARPAATPPTTAAKGPSKAPPPAPAPTVRASCDPPYVIDGAGHRQYKLECLK